MTFSYRLTVNLTDDEAEALSDLAKASKVSKAWLGRYAICEFLARAKDDQRQVPFPLLRAASKDSS